MSCCVNQTCVPTLVVNSVTVTDNVATLTTNGVLPTKGRFNIKFCGCCVPVCSTATSVTITDGTTTYATVLTRCGNTLTLPTLVCQLKKFCVAHFCGSSTTAGTAIIQDRLVDVTLYRETTATTTPTAEPAVASVSTAKNKA